MNAILAAAQAEEDSAKAQQHDGEEAGGSDSRGSILVAPAEDRWRHGSGAAVPPGLLERFRAWFTGRSPSPKL